MNEPILTQEDQEAWDEWLEVAHAHARTGAHKRRVDEAVHAVREAVALPEVRSAPRRPSVSWSAGKDSTVLTHLACVLAGCGAELDVVSEKDDLDYPGEREYVERYARDWGLSLEILTPSQSPKEFLAARAAGMMACDDIHSRKSALSKAVFYGLMEESDKGRGLTMLGLRADESGIRAHVLTKAVTAARKRLREELPGPRSELTYWHKGARQWRSMPLGKWRGVDVYAYAVTHNIELLPVYKCIALMHRERPELIRKSWWVPGAHGADGQIAWLRRYYPSLYRQLATWMPDAKLQS